MADFLKLNEEYFNNLLSLKNGITSHDCFSRVFSIIDSKEFMKLFIEWIKNIVNDNKGRFLSIDGKAIKSATDKVNEGNTPYIVSAFLNEIGISIGQIKVNDKSNEITAIPELLDLIDISRLFVTIDAIGTQTNIANRIIDKNGNYILKVKSNQRDLLDDIKTYFDIELSTNKKGNSVENISTIRKIVFSLAKLDKSMGDKLTLNQKITRYNHDFKNIENLIFHVIPSS